MQFIIRGIAKSLVFTPFKVMLFNPLFSDRYNFMLIMGKNDSSKCHISTHETIRRNHFISNLLMAIINTLSNPSVPQVTSETRNMILIFLTFLLLFVIIYKWKLNPSKYYWEDKGIPFDKENTSNILVAFQLLTKQKTVIGLDQGIYDKLKHHRFGGVTEFGGKPAVLITDLDLIKRVMIKDFNHFVDRQPQKYQNDPYFDKMLVSLHGQEWKDVRSQLTPTFTSGKIRKMFDHFNKSGEGLANLVKAEEKDGGVLISDLVGRYIIDVIGATAFGMDTEAIENKDSVFLKMANKVMNLSTMRIVKSLIFLNAPKLANFLGIEISPKDAMSFFATILSQALKDRADNPQGRGDFLELIVEARKNFIEGGNSSSSSNSSEDDFEILNPDGEKENPKESRRKPEAEKKQGLSDDLVMAQSLMFFLAGVDTTNALITFALYLMAVHPDIQEKVWDEAEKVCGQDSLSYDHVVKLEYLDMFISEIQRKYPIASRLKRLCTEDYPIPDSNYVISKGMSVTIPVQGIHHDPRYYPDPERFDPERFSLENSANRPQCAYLPFGQGPRNCIGMRFALIESKVAIIHLVRNFLIEPTTNTPIPIKIDAKIGVNRPVADLHLKFSPRKN